VYLQGFHFHTFAESIEKGKPFHSSSFAESKALKLISEQGADFVDLNKRYIGRLNGASHSFNILIFMGN
jgi:hypothetical protein